MIYSRSEIIDLLYSEYDDNEVILSVKADLRKLSDDDFMELCKRSHINLKFLRKNTYYWVS
jgi:hypothetical protein